MFSQVKQPDSNLLTLGVPPPFSLPDKQRINDCFSDD